MTKKQFLDNFIEIHSRNLHDQHKQDHALAIKSGLKSSFNEAEDLKSTITKTKLLAAKLAKSLNWDLLSKDELAFRKLFLKALFANI